MNLVHLFSALSDRDYFELFNWRSLPWQVDNPDNTVDEGDMDAKNQGEKTSKDVDPSQDAVYQKTTSVVKSIVELNTGVQIARPEEFVDLVKVCC